MKNTNSLQIILNNLLKSNIFNWNKNQKLNIFSEALGQLNNHHFKNCEMYKRIFANHRKNFKTKKIENNPFIPVELFKKYHLYSTKENFNNKVITSSGTGGKKSQIYLDRITSINQSRVLSKILATYFNNNKYSLLVMDKKITNSNMISASSAGILGFSLYANKIFFLKNNNNSFNLAGIKRFIADKSKNKLVFGFTGQVWEQLHYYKNLFNKYNIKFKNIDLLHGGGWKKMSDKKISQKIFQYTLKKKFGFSNIINYYGLVEQTGSIFFQCKKNNYFHTSVFSDIIVRNQKFQSVINQKGSVQLISLIPTSYPGHNIITQDIGEILGEDDCSCGIKGKYFKIYGRLKSSEIRGCSDAR